MKPQQQQQQRRLAQNLAVATFNRQQLKNPRQEFPSLANMAIEVVADNFDLYPHLNGLNQLYKDIVIQKTRKDWSVKITAPHIESEKYWKEACILRGWGNVRIEDHANLWKVAYMEKHVQELIENLKDPEEIPQLLDTLKAVRSYIFTLILSQYPVNIDFKKMFSYLPFLNHLSIVFGVKHAGMNYKRQALGMKMNEAINLSESLKQVPYLLVLKLPGNQLEDDFIKIIMQGLEFNRSIVELDLSHNKISQKGAKRIAKFLRRNELLIQLDLSNNQIDHDGFCLIGQALKTNTVLQALNLKLNLIDDKAGASFFRFLTHNKTLQSINLAANSLGYQAAGKLADYLADTQCSMKYLVLSSNKFGSDSYELLKVGLNKNTSLSKIDLRMNKLSVDHEKELQNIIIKHELTNNKIPFITDFNFQERIQSQFYFGLINSGDFLGKKIKEIDQKEDAEQNQNKKND